MVASNAEGDSVVMGWYLLQNCSAHDIAQHMLYAVNVLSWFASLQNGVAFRADQQQALMQARGDRPN
jgi:hypothetical protein